MNLDEPGTIDTDHVVVRNLRSSDLDWIVRIDAHHTGRPRREYYKVKLSQAAADTGIVISLAAEVKGEPAGFLMGRLYYGEFGQPEPVAILDSLGVAEAFASQHVGRAMMRQLELNLSALGIERLQTEVDWDKLELLGFFQRAGFRPAPRLCLEKPVTRP
jgi:ribosomal protein S18 acetylase RimI-like enzyme